MNEHIRAFSKIITERNEEHVRKELARRGISVEDAHKRVVLVSRSPFQLAIGEMPPLPEVWLIEDWEAQRPPPAKAPPARAPLRWWERLLEWIAVGLGAAR